MSAPSIKNLNLNTCLKEIRILHLFVISWRAFVVDSCDGESTTPRRSKGI